MWVDSTPQEQYDQVNDEDGVDCSVDPRNLEEDLQDCADNIGAWYNREYTETAESLKDAYQGAIDKLRQNVANWFYDVLGDINRLAEDLKTWIEDAPGEIIGFVLKPFEFIGDVLGAVADGVKGVLDSANDLIKKAF